VLVGYFLGTLDFACQAGGVTSQGSNDVFILRIDALNGSCGWQSIRTFGDGADQRAISVATDQSNNIFVTGYAKGIIGYTDINMTSKSLDCGTLQQDVFVLKLNPSGVPVWGVRFGNEVDLAEGKAITVDPTGDPVITGRFEGMFTIGASTFTAAGGSDVFTAKLDKATGAVKWAKQFGTSGDQIGESVATDGQGSVFVAGGMAGSPQFGIPKKTLSALGPNDAFLIEYTSGGTERCGVNYGDAMAQTGTSIATVGGDLILGSNFQGAVGNLGCGMTAASVAANDALLVKLKPPP
jgi:hypothetical protein